MIVVSNSNMLHQWIYADAAAISETSRGEARARQSELTKPPGALGILETIALDFAAFQGKSIPDLEHIVIRIFAADHGVTQQGVSAFPQEVTAQMIENFLAGGAAISVLSEKLEADLAVVNLGCARSVRDRDGLFNAIVAEGGSADFTRQEAMNEEQLHKALQIGRQYALVEKCQMFIGGEMGIGNTTAAAAIIACCSEIEVIDAVGRGTGIDDEGMQRKLVAVTEALALHGEKLEDPLAVLRCVGGLEIAALVGAYIHCAQVGVPVLVDGYICTAAAMLAQRINPSVAPWFIYAHRSDEKAHGRVLQSLRVKPLLDLGMRLGEGSGAAVAACVIRQALALHAGMATFAEARVSDGSSDTD
jgi:nicotinate-nucleotide--dimethylbenzimidazole phosphoribosyltransferase